MLRQYGVAMLGGATAALLCACGLLSGVDDLHLSNVGDASIGVVVDSGPPATQSTADAEPPANDAEITANEAGAVDAGPPEDADASPVFMAMGAGDAAQGRPGFDAVVGGNLLTSPNYSLMLTVGEAPGGNGVSVSSNYRFVGGVVGTTQQ